MAFLDARRAFQARLHQTSIEGPTRTVRDTLRPDALRQAMLDAAAPLEIHRLPFVPATRCVRLGRHRPSS